MASHRRQHVLDNIVSWAATSAFGDVIGNIFHKAGQGGTGEG
jgi:hypothetical protein